MDNKTVRLLRADEIECRVSVINEKGLSLLLYKDARVDQKILDETFSPFGWRRSHQCINGNLYCTVEVRDSQTGEWVAKQDVGTVGYAEKEKSQASDSFKRACFNWGIGRELYTAPFIWIPAGYANIKKKEDKDGRYYCNDRFAVRLIEYNSDREIVSLTVVNATRGGQAVYEWGAGKAQAPDHRQPGLSRKQIVSLEDEMRRTGVNIEAIRKRYHIDDPKGMSVELYERVMGALSKTKSKTAA